MMSKRRLVVVKREIKEKRRNEIGRRSRNVLLLWLLLALSRQCWFLFKSQNHKFSSDADSDLAWLMTSSTSNYRNSSVVKSVQLLSTENSNFHVGVDTSEHPVYLESKYTPHVKELLEIIEKVTLHLALNASRPWTYDPHKYCASGYHIFVDKPYTAPTAIECNPVNVWCEFFKHIFADGTRVLSYNVSVGESTADMIKPGTMPWGQCIGSSAPDGQFSMNNFQDVKVQMAAGPSGTGYAHVYKLPWEHRRKIPVFRGHPRMVNLGPWKRDAASCRHMTVASGDFGHRPMAVLFSLDHPELLDARVSSIRHPCQIHNETNGMDKLFGWGEYTRTEDIKIPSEDYYTKYQAVVVLGGIGAAFRTPVHLSAGQAVVLQRFTYEEWYIKYMTPFEHYIPLKNDLSDMKDILEWVRDHPDRVKKIAQQGKHFYEEWLSFPQNDEHWHELLWRLGELIHRSGSERLKSGTNRAIWPGPIVPYRFIRGGGGNFISEDRNITRKPYLEYDAALGENTQT